MNVPIRVLPEDQRPRERLLCSGVDSLSDAELLAVLLGGGRVGASAVELAHELLQAHGGLHGLSSARPEELALHAGVGPAKAARVVAASALVRRGRPAGGVRITCSADLAQVVVPLLAHERTEKLLVVVLDGGHRVRRVETVAQGAVDRTPLPVREVLATVLRHDGRSFALAHNHPGGGTTPSSADVRATALVHEACRNLGTILVDHLVVAGWRWAAVVAPT